MQGETPAARAWRPNAFWIATAIYFAIVSLGSNLLEIRYSYFDPGLAGSWGFTFQQQGQNVRVQSVEPQSKAAALGLRPGDTLTSDEPAFFRSIPVTGETVRFTRIAPAPAKQFLFDAPRAAAPPMAVPNLSDRLADDGVRLLLGLGGILILWRASRRRSAFILGLALLSMSPFPPVFLPLGPYASYFWNAAVFGLIYMQFGLLLPLFAMVFLAEAGVKIPSWPKLLLWAGATETLVGGMFIWILPAGLFSGGGAVFAEQLRILVALVLFGLTVALLLIGLRRSGTEARHRFALLLLGIGLIYLSNMLYALFFSVSGSNPRLLTNTATIGRSIGALLFAYAVLRHKVIDVGFTLNRTLVYGGVSAILLAVFGLAEWGLHQLLELEGWEGSALISAALAVAVFLAFHPLRNVVEHYVAAIFFRPWRNKEQALRKFVHEGGFFTDPARLAAAFADALETFTGGSCCVYRLSDSQSYVCASGKMAPLYVDDAVAVALRAQAAVCEIDSSLSGAEGVLAFPMIHAHDLEGFAVLGAKGNGDRYRPDEIELVEWATRQIGQDLYRLDVEQLKRERDERDREIAVLTGRNADLQMALANRSSPRVRRAVAKGAAA